VTKKRAAPKSPQIKVIVEEKSPRGDRKDSIESKEEELGGGQVDAVMNRLNKTNAQDIMKAIRDRRKKVGTPNTTGSAFALPAPGVVALKPSGSKPQ